MRHLMSALGAAVLLVAAGCGSSGSGVGTPPPTTATPASRGIPVAEPIAAPSISLHDQHGKPVRLSTYRGEFTIVTFLYTRCRDVCPVIADRLNEALRRLSRAGYPANVLAVSVDPRGDTRAAVTRFARRHRLLPRFHYLLGSAAELRPIWSAYHVAADPDSSDTAVAHSAFEVLIDRSGRERVYYTSQVRAADVVADVRKLARS
jgi:protein SCO1/2